MVNDPPQRSLLGDDGNQVYAHSGICSTVTSSVAPMSGVQGPHWYHVPDMAKGNGYNIVLNGTRGFVREVYLEVEKCPDYCKITPGDEVVALDGLPEEAVPGEIYFETQGYGFHEVYIEPPGSKKRILEV